MKKSTFYRLQVYALASLIMLFFLPLMAFDWAIRLISASLMVISVVLRGFCEAAVSNGLSKKLNQKLANQKLKEAEEAAKAIENEFDA